MSGYDKMWFEEAIGWNGLRAMREARYIRRLLKIRRLEQNPG